MTKMDLCVGAVTRRVVIEAASLRVPQIVASRRQVDIGRGYTGMDQDELVDLVRKLSAGQTKVVRDHGGPYKNGNPDDDWYASLDADVAAGFDGLHLDVSELPRDEQVAELQNLLDRYANKIEHIEIGGERDAQEWLDHLITNTAVEGWAPTYVVMDVGGHIHADRQCGTPRTVEWVTEHVERYHEQGVRAKAHNADWLGRRSRYEGVLDALNIAPEYAGVETDALLATLRYDDMIWLLEYAHDSRAWERWFDPGEGTYLEKARCAVRYVLERDEVQARFNWAATGVHEWWIRARVNDAIRSI